jgi:tripartite-type tricarboxylate transporter receptor subunit TctC
MVNGLLTGTAPVAIVGLPNFIPFIRSGTVKALAIDSEARSALFPDVPTLAELGFPNLAPVYFAFVAPAGTPRPISRACMTRSPLSALSRNFARRASPTSGSTRFSTRRSTSRNTSSDNAPMAQS